jgi:sterol 3beta-glucosyltransferase
VAFFYNVANGFRNMPSYVITNEVHRPRDEIVGLGSGLNVAGKVRFPGAASQKSDTNDV